MDNYKQRAKELVEKMTLKEKTGQLAQLCMGFKAYDRDENNEIVLTEEFKQYVQKFGGIGMLNNYFRADPWVRGHRGNKNDEITLEEREKAYNILQKYIVENTRLGIPVLNEEDTPHGRCVLDGILYPVSFNVGCSFNPSLYRKVTKEIGTECRIGGCHIAYLSNLDMAMDPRWGRGGTVCHRNKELRGFEKISLLGGEKKRVTFSIGYDDLKEWSINKKYEIFSQEIKLMIGDSSRNIVFEDNIKI